MTAPVLSDEECDRLADPVYRATSLTSVFRGRGLIRAGYDEGYAAGAAARVPPRELFDRCQNYLASGGLWTPDLMEHGKVSDLIRDIRDWLHDAAPERGTTQSGEVASATREDAATKGATAMPSASTSPDPQVASPVAQVWCPHVGGLGPPFPHCEICTAAPQDAQDAARLEQQLTKAYLNGITRRACISCKAPLLGKGGQTGHHCGLCNATIGSM